MNLDKLETVFQAADTRVEEFLKREGDLGRMSLCTVNAIQALALLKSQSSLPAPLTSQLCEFIMDAFILAIGTSLSDQFSRVYDEAKTIVSDVERAIQSDSSEELTAQLLRKFQK